MKKKLHSMKKMCNFAFGKKSFHGEGEISTEFTI